MKPTDVIRNSFFDNLGDDVIAVDTLGVPIARASTREAVEKSAPGAAGYFSAEDFQSSENFAPIAARAIEPARVEPSIAYDNNAPPAGAPLNAPSVFKPIAEQPVTPGPVSSTTVDLPDNFQPIAERPVYEQEAPVAPEQAPANTEDPVPEPPAAA